MIDTKLAGDKMRHAREQVLKAQHGAHFFIEGKLVIDHAIAAM
jgi:hypothetical protein